ncbi:MAG: YeeE/YedE thiosulfate transporter family protein [Tepidimonas sp.]|uniref:YeeE/YedE thiosulfate transporter family protein n=1 Tax=Tepidimonas sp. TaxID=2002775 RepID=UPI00259EC336|nr:YeeE/YedE thiosulfate transporter family protein [Tepidimonas sp.]MDM7457117.1 YeeE/YedE thiosulfate transporter family protein [Tepidimonas sp.]
MVRRSLRWVVFYGTRDSALLLLGAVWMWVGGVTALGCTVGQGLSGRSTLSVTSAIAFAGIVAGALGGLRFQWWLLERE